MVFQPKATTGSPALLLGVGLGEPMGVTIRGVLVWEGVDEGVDEGINVLFVALKLALELDDDDGDLEALERRA